MNAISVQQTYNAFYQLGLALVPVSRCCPYAYMKEHSQTTFH